MIKISKLIIKRLIFSIFFLSIISCAFAGARIVVLGSSTAAGSGPKDTNNGWVNRYRTYLQSLDPTHQVINLSSGGSATYSALPAEDSVANRPKPDTLRNITKALSYNPDIIILNYPTNDVGYGYSVKEQLDNYAVIVEKAAQAGVPVWIATTQGRNLDRNKRDLLIQTRDSIHSVYGDKAIDFWTTISNDDGYINSLYDSGDGIHLNDDAHKILFDRVVAKDILSHVEIKELKYPVKISFGGIPVEFPWNSLSSYTAGGLIPDLIDTEGNSTGIKLALNDSFGGINSEGPQSTTTSMEIPTNASKESFWGNAGSTLSSINENTGGFIISGLHPGKYTFSFYSGRVNAPDNRKTRFTVTGKNEKSGDVNSSENMTLLVVLPEIEPKDDGTVTVVVTAGSNNDNEYKFFYINAMMISPWRANAGNQDFLSNKFSVAPNPVIDVVEIDNSQGIKDVFILDMNGRLINKFSGLNQKEKAILSLSSLTKGIYLVKVVDLNNKSSSRLIVKN